MGFRKNNQGEISTVPRNRRNISVYRIGEYGRKKIPRSLIIGINDGLYLHNVLYTGEAFLTGNYLFAKTDNPRNKYNNLVRKGSTSNENTDMDIMLPEETDPNPTPPSPLVFTGNFVPDKGTATTRYRKGNALAKNNSNRKIKSKKRIEQIVKSKRQNNITRTS